MKMQFCDPNCQQPYALPTTSSGRSHGRRNTRCVGKLRIDAMLPEADVVFSSVPLTAASRGMLGEAQFP